jgi:hypothetical protein
MLLRFWGAGGGYSCSLETGVWTPLMSALMFVDGLTVRSKLLAMRKDE